MSKLRRIFQEGFKVKSDSYKSHLTFSILLTHRNFKKTTLWVMFFSEQRYILRTRSFCSWPTDQMPLQLQQVFFFLCVKRTQNQTSVILSLPLNLYYHVSFKYSHISSIRLSNVIDFFITLLIVVFLYILQIYSLKVVTFYEIAYVSCTLYENCWMNFRV